MQTDDGMPQKIAARQSWFWLGCQTHVPLFRHGAESAIRGFGVSIRWAFAVDLPLVSAPDARAYFFAARKLRFLARQENLFRIFRNRFRQSQKVAKKKATPESTPGCAETKGFLWLLSFGEAKESMPAGQRRKPTVQRPHTPARQARKKAAVEQYL